MTITKTTTGPTEGDLEAEIHAVFKVAFPWLPAGSIQHQTTFSFSFGGKVVEIDGAKREAAKARADILLHHNQQPLAILELKRAGISLDADDEAQGLSYARVLHPRPPLVVLPTAPISECLKHIPAQSGTRPNAPRIRLPN